MAVTHLKTSRKRPLARVGGDLVDYRAGFDECAREVAKYLHGVKGLDRSVKDNLLCHLTTPDTPTPTMITSPTPVSRLITTPGTMIPVSYGTPMMTTPAWSLPGGAGMPYSHIVSNTEHRSASVLSTSPDSAISCGSRTPSPVCGDSGMLQSTPMASMYRGHRLHPSAVDLSTRCSPISVKCQTLCSEQSMNSSAVPVLALATPCKPAPVVPQSQSVPASRGTTSWRPW